MRSPTRTGKSLAGLPAGPGAEGVGEGGLWEGESVRRCPRVKHSPETHLRNARSHFEKRIARRRKMHLKNAAPCFGKRSFENAVRVSANAETVDVCAATHRATCFLLLLHPWRGWLWWLKWMAANTALHFFKCSFMLRKTRFENAVRVSANAVTVDVCARLCFAPCSSHPLSTHAPLGTPLAGTTTGRCTRMVLTTLKVLCFVQT